MKAWYRTWGAMLAAAALVGMAGCASVSVYKVDRVTGKIKQDAAEGLRFYLPRPYVSVYEPFIVASEVYLASGEMSPDSQYVLLTEVPDGLRRLVNAKLVKGDQRMGGVRIDAAQVQVSKEAKGMKAKPRVAGPQSAPLDATPGDAPLTDSEDAPAEAPSPASAPSAPAEAASAASAASAATAPAGSRGADNGVLNYKAVNDVNAYAVTPQPRYFNILWLPDFDEQYVVSGKAGLGNAGVLLGFGQGWSLQSLDAHIDNSATAKPLLDFYAGTIGALQKVATAKIEGVLGVMGGAPQGAPVNADVQRASSTFTGGTPVTLKVTKVRIVAPGLYPILKPQEAAGIRLSDEQARRVLAPVPPLTNIAFNTYDVIVIEAARPTGDSALRIQQYVDSSAPGSRDGAKMGANGPQAAMASAAHAASGAQPVPVASLAEAQRQLNMVLSKPENATVNKMYFLANVTQDGGVVKVKLRKRLQGPTGTLSALADDAAIKALVVSELGKRKVSVAAEHITVQR